MWLSKYIFCCFLIPWFLLKKPIYKVPRSPPPTQTVFVQYLYLYLYLYLCCIWICICAVFVLRNRYTVPPLSLTRTICILSAQTFIFSISYLAFSIFDIYNCTYFHPSSLDIWCIVYISDTWYFEAQPDHEIIREFDKPNGLSDCYEYDGSTGLT